MAFISGNFHLILQDDIRADRSAAIEGKRWATRPL
jgi:hypothetical protein